jgi:hypothetical protein
MTTPQPKTKSKRFKGALPPNVEATPEGLDFFGDLLG